MQFPALCEIFPVHVCARSCAQTLAHWNIRSPERRMQNKFPRPLRFMLSARALSGHVFDLLDTHYSFNICLENSRECATADWQAWALPDFTRSFSSVDDARLLRIHSTAFRQVHLSNVSPKESGDILTISSLEAIAVKLLLFAVRH